MAKAKSAAKKEGKIVRATQFVIESPDGKQVGSLEGKSDGSGLWLTGGDGSTIAIYNCEGQMAIGYYSAAQMKKPGGPKFMAFALSHNKSEGRPILQFAKDSEDDSPSFMYLDEIAPVADLQERIKVLEDQLAIILARPKTVFELHNETPGRAVSSEVEEPQPVTDDSSLSPN